MAKGVKARESSADLVSRERVVVFGHRHHVDLNMVFYQKDKSTKNFLNKKKSMIMYVRMC